MNRKTANVLSAFVFGVSVFSGSVLARDGTENIKISFRTGVKFAAPNDSPGMIKVPGARVVAHFSKGKAIDYARSIHTFCRIGVSEFSGFELEIPAGGVLETVPSGNSKWKSKNVYESSARLIGVRIDGNYTEEPVEANIHCTGGGGVEIQFWKKGLGIGNIRYQFGPIADVEAVSVTK